MTNPWEAEIEFSMELAEELVGRQFPELLPVELEFYGQGWDNVAVLVNGEWVFRFPQRELARLTMEGELACLTALSDHLPLAIPHPQFVGWPTTAYPFVFSGYRKLPGTTGCSASLSADQRRACAPLLASFLRSLHNPALAVACQDRVHSDRIDRANMQRFLVPMEKRLHEIRCLPECVERAGLVSLARDLAQTPAWEGTRRVVHGDLYARHLLVNEAGQLCGVIDWGDGHLGDPALDLSVLYSFLAKEARPLFEAVYGGIDERTRGRAKFRALHYGVTLTHYGEQAADEAIAQAGRDALTFLLE